MYRYVYICMCVYIYIYANVTIGDSRVWLVYCIVYRWAFFFCSMPNKKTGAAAAAPAKIDIFGCAQRFAFDLLLS